MNAACAPSPSSFQSIGDAEANDTPFLMSRD
jgi:hypothetical protein